MGISDKDGYNSESVEINISNKTLIKSSVANKSFSKVTMNDNASWIIVIPKYPRSFIINEEMQENIPRERVSFLSANLIKEVNEEDRVYYHGILTSLTLPWMSAHKSNLNSGSLAMALQNISIQEGLWKDA